MLFGGDRRNETGRPIAIKCFFQLDEIIVASVDFEIFIISDTSTGIGGKINERLFDNWWVIYFNEILHLILFIRLDMDYS